MPSSTLDGLADAYAHVSSGNAAAMDTFHSFASLLERAQIPFLVLKGTDVLIRLYGIRGIRPLSDVDLLVHESDLATIDRLLTEAGYAPQIDGNPCYASPGHGLSFDLVTTLWYLDEQGLAELWTDARPHTLPPRSVMLLATDDLLIHLIAYAVIHRGALTPGWEQDLRLLLRRESIDWTSVIRKARRYLLTTPLFYGLSYLRRRMPTLPIPDSSLQLLAPSGCFQKILYRMLERLVTARPIPEIGHFLLWLTRPADQQLPWLRRAFFPPKRFLEYRYGTAAARTPWRIRCRRLVSLTRAVFILMTRIVRQLLWTPARDRA